MLTLCLSRFKAEVGRKEGIKHWMGCRITHNFLLVCVVVRRQLVLQLTDRYVMVTAADEIGDNGSEWKLGRIGDRGILVRNSGLFVGSYPSFLITLFLIASGP